MDGTLAGRWPRLLAQIVDGLIIAVPAGIAAAVMAMTTRMTSDGGQPEVSFVGVILAALVDLYALVIVVIQLVKLHKQGQTIGKQFAKVRIVKVADGSNGGIVTNFLMRALVPGLIGAVPFLGPIFSIVDILFIFRADRRCIHDFIAGTRVVTA